MGIDKYHSPGCWITVIWHTLLCAFVTPQIAAYDTIAIVIISFSGGKLELLAEQSRQMLGSSGEGTSDNEAVKTI